MALTPKQQAFIAEYMIDLNATQAAIRAGYSPATARMIGYENLTKPYIAKIIEKAMNERSANNGITADYVLKGIKGIADKEDARETDKLKAFELLGKHLKLFTDNVNLSGSVAVQILDDID